MLTIMTACTPEVQTYTEKTSTSPAIKEERFVTSDNSELSFRRWLPAKKPRAIIVALHGMNDYSHSFEGSGQFFKNHGIAVFAYDQRGFGISPHIGIWGGEQNFIADLRDYVNAISIRYPHTPIYIMGESMGGAVAISAAADPDFPKIKGLILSAPAVWGAHTVPWLYRSMLWTAAHTVPYMQLTGSGLKIIASNNYPMLRALSADPLVIKKTRVDAVYGVVHLMDSAYEHIPQIKTPTLLLYGAHDQVIPKQPVEIALTRFTIPIDYAHYPQGYHMLLRDLESKIVMEDILSWIQYPDEALPSGFGEVIEP